MKRGELWTVSGGPGFAGKPRPVVIVQDDGFLATPTVTICPITSDDTEASLVRVVLIPSFGNGLRLTSRVMADKVTTVPRTRLGKRIGALSIDEIAGVDRALLLFLGLALP